jgi:hypothetical protein
MNAEMNQTKMGQDPMLSSRLPAVLRTFINPASRDKHTCALPRQSLDDLIFYFLQSRISPSKPSLCYTSISSKL